MPVHDIKVELSDITKYVYFITELTQNSGDNGLYGTLGEKSDLMGGVIVNANY